jgi:hypothetical protein
VRRLGLVQFQVFNGVVCPVTISVVNDFFGEEEASEVCFHYETMFSDTTRGSVRVRVVRAVDVNIALRVLDLVGPFGRGPWP